MGRATRAEIDIGALQQNYHYLQSLAGAGRCMAVIKADAYGHGIVPVCRALSAAPSFAVACVDEAVTLREAGVTAPIVVLEGALSEREWRSCQHHALSVVLHHAFQLAFLALSGRDRVGVWLKFNTGMNRLGFPVKDAAQLVQQCLGAETVSLQGLMTHFACADEPHHPLTIAQVAAIKTLKSQFPELPFSAVNSAAHLHFADLRYDWVRPGILLYGASPSGDGTLPTAIRPVMSLMTGIIAVRRIAVGESIGYGARWTAARETRMGVAAIGYADGYPRHAPSGTPVMVDGHRVPLIGRVSMDMIVVDLTDCPDSVGIGAAVELWGRNVPVDEVAKQAGTIGYELLTGVTARVPRVYHREMTGG